MKVEASYLGKIMYIFKKSYSNQPTSVGSRRLPTRELVAFTIRHAFSVTYPTHFYILGHNFSTVKATSGSWSLEVVSGVFPH